MSAAETEETPRGVDAGASATAVSVYESIAAEEAKNDQQAEECVFLTYNVDLGFLEERLLGLCRATGARVTVLADRGVWAPDVRAVFHAGRSYHVGLVETRAFHPKVTVLAGAARAVAAVGSGNLTMGGWQHNAELATVFTGDRAEMPTVFGDIRNVLADLADVTTLDQVAGRAVARMVRNLDGLLASADPVETGHQVAASWQGPLIDRLPTDPVVELRLSAPFHDEVASAVRRLLERLRPERVRISVQPGWTMLNPGALQAVLADYQGSRAEIEVTVVRDPDDLTSTTPRYRHGKLIEWVTSDGALFAMTGSPNLSVVALLRDTAAGGNHEVAVIGPIEASLFPDGETISLIDVPRVRDSGGPDPDESGPHEEPGPEVAACFRANGVITVHLTRTAVWPVTIQVSQRGTSHDEWMDVGTVAAGQVEAEVEAEVVAGSRIRLAWSGADKTPVFAAPIFVTDPDQVTVRMLPTKRLSRTQRAEPVDLLGTDTGLLNALAADLAAYAEDVAVTRGPSVGGGEAAAGAPVSDDGEGDSHVEPWLWLQDDHRNRFGAGLTEFGLGLPYISGHRGGVAYDSGDEETAPWIDALVDEKEIGLDDDRDAFEPDFTEFDAEPDLASASSTENGSEDGAAVAAPVELGVDVEPAVDHRTDNDRLRSARRRFITKNAPLAGAVPITSRLLLLRLALVYWTAGNWDRDDEPMRLVADLIGSLDRGSIPEQMEARVGSLAAVAFTAVRQRVDLQSRNPGALLYRSLVAEHGYLVAASDEALIEGFVGWLSNAHGAPLDAVYVLDTVADLITGNVLLDLVDTLEAHGWTVHQPSARHLQVRGKFANPLQVVLDAVAQVEDIDQVAAWAINQHGKWALAVWRRPDLVTVYHHGGTRRWRHQRLSGVAGPAAVAADNRSPDPARIGEVISKPRHSPTAAARAVLAAAGIEDPTPCRSGDPTRS